MARTRKYDKEERKRVRSEAARVRRATRRNDPVLCAIDKEKERLRYEKRKSDGKIKLINNLNAKDKKKMRAKWKVNTQNSRLRKKALEVVMETPPTTPSPERPEPEVLLAQQNSSRSSGSGSVGPRARRLRAKAYRQLDKCKAENARLKKIAEKFRKRFERLQKKCATTNPDSPTKKVKALIQKRNFNKMKRRLLFAEVMSKELTMSYLNLKSKKTKRFFTRMVDGRLLRKYKLLSAAGTFFPKQMYPKIRGRARNVKSYLNEKELSKASQKMANEILLFLSNDENSWQCPGKKDFVGRGMKKTQKRFLTDTLKNLHKKFNEHLNKNKKLKKERISYASFCMLKPSHILKPNTRDRETCLCILHENMKLMVRKLHQLKVLRSCATEDLVNDICCTNVKEQCLGRICPECKNKEIQSQEFEDVDIEYTQWMRVDETYMNAQKEIKTTKITTKQSIKVKISALLLNLKKSFEVFIIHIRDLKHQYQIFKLLRLVEKDSLNIHIDFSENYACKYGAEPQSLHFGGSRRQLTLHTGVAYSSEQTKPISFCTVSESLRHDAKAVAAHLSPILTYLLDKFPQVSRINFMSDGPTAQYKNKTLFTIISKILPKSFPTIKAITWNYSVSGHGKGAADGIGGVLKRTADRIVAHRKDVPNINTFLTQLQISTPGVHLHQVTAQDITKMDETIPTSIIIPTVKGVRSVLQVTWSRVNGDLFFNRLGCLDCSPGEVCKHFHSNKITISEHDADENNEAIIENELDERQEKVDRDHEHQEVLLSEQEQFEGSSTATTERIESCSTKPTFPKVLNVGDWVTVAYEKFWYPGT